MPFGVSPDVIAVGVLALIIGGGVAALYYRRVVAGVVEDVEALEKKAQENLDPDSTGYGVEMDPPSVSRSVLDVFRAWRHLSVQERMAKRGYVKWYRVGARFRRPQWIKPEKKDSGYREYYHKGDDVTYVFPEEAMVNDGRTSAYVAIHKVGEAEPINLRNPGWAPLDGSALQRLFDIALSRNPSGGLGNLPLSPQQLKYLGIILAGLVIWGVTQFTGVFS